MKRLTNEANRLLIGIVLGIIAISMLASCSDICNECGHEMYKHPDGLVTDIKTINNHSFFTQKIVKVCPIK